MFGNDPRNQNQNNLQQSRTDFSRTGMNFGRSGNQGQYD